MTQTTSRFFDEIAKVMTDAAGAAQGMKREVDTIVRTQAERLVGDMDLVKRDEFEALREMVILAREENERLAAKIADLEAKIAG
jgi:BMFP domain-containing protein YqiC